MDGFKIRIVFFVKFSMRPPYLFKITPVLPNFKADMWNGSTLRLSLLLMVLHIHLFLLAPSLIVYHIRSSFFLAQFGLLGMQPSFHKVVCSRFSNFHANEIVNGGSKECFVLVAISEIEKELCICFNLYVANFSFLSCHVGILR